MLQADERRSVEICCNALYGSPNSADSPPGNVSNMIPMSGFTSADQEDSKENLAPTEGFPQFSLMKPCGKAAALPDQAARKGPGPTSRAEPSSPVLIQPLQPHQLAQGCPGMTTAELPFNLLYMPATSAMSQPSSPMLNSPVCCQPLADVCLFGSPPQNQSGTRHSPHFFSVMGDHTHLASATDHCNQEAVHGQSKPVRNICLGTHAAEPDEAKSGLMEMDSEAEFMALLKAAEQQRVSAL